MEKISNRIKEAMEARDITQEELAKRANVNKGALSCWLRDLYQPKQKSIYKLAKALNVSEVWLMGDESVEMERKSDAEKFGEWANAFNATHSAVMLSDDETDLIKKYRMADDRGKETMRCIAEAESQRSRPELTPLAAHHNSGDFTDEQQAKIQEFIKHVTEDKE